MAVLRDYVQEQYTGDHEGVLFVEGGDFVPPRWNMTTGGLSPSRAPPMYPWAAWILPSGA